MEDVEEMVIIDKRSKKQTFKRGYKACLNCRTRKVKCDLGPFDNPHDPPCVRCKRERRECVFPETKRGGARVAKQSITSIKEENAAKSMAQVITSVIQGRTTKFELEKNSSETGNSEDDEISITADPPTLQSALYFLAKAAGSVAKEDLRDRVDAVTKYNEVERAEAMVKRAVAIPDLIGKHACGEHGHISMEPPGSNVTSFVEPSREKPGTVPLIEKLSSIRPKPSLKLANIEYIGENKMLTETEARKRIDAFFLTMHPYSPYIPLQLQDPDELARYPLLLCTILTASARYHTLHDLGLSDTVNDKHIELHERLWVYCQRLISQTIWAEASTRSIGTILAFLLFTEWNPRAIHWRWSDYANNPGATDGAKAENSDKQGNDSMAGLAAMRRSDRMSWMLTGNAVRLAQDLNVIEFSSKLFVVTHICEMHTAMNLNKRSSLSESLSEVTLNGFDDDDVDNEQFFLERILENDRTKERWAKFLERFGSKNHELGLADIEREFLNDEYLLYYYDTDTTGSQVDPGFRLKFSKLQRAKIEILKIVTLGYENVYSGKLSSNDRHQRLSMLSVLSPLIEGWYNTYKSLLQPCQGAQVNLNMSTDKNLVFEVTNKMDHESLICDYYYCQLYIYSLALQWDNEDQSASKLRLNEITKSARYVELAYNAAKEILNSAQRVHKLKLLKYMPVRWIMRVVRSIVFMIKCYLTLTGHGIMQNPEANTILTMSVLPTDEIIQTIQRTAIVLREATPDELHLCSRYSTILMYLCTEMKLRSKPNMQPPIPRSISNDLIPKNNENSKSKNVENAEGSISNNNSFSGSSSEDFPSLQAKTTSKEDHFASGGSIPSNSHPKSQQSVHPVQSTSSTFIPENTPYSTNQNSNISGAGNNTTTNPTTTGYLPPQIVDWFNDNNEIGLDFVGPWTEMVERQFVNNVTDSTSENFFEDFQY